MDSLQKFSKIIFVPVLILPVVGVLIVFGNIFTTVNLLEKFPIMDQAVTKNFGSILTISLLSILMDLSIIFYVGIILGLARKKRKFSRHY